MKELAEKIPKYASFQYASKDMIPFRKEVDDIAELLCWSNPEADKANSAFQRELDEKEQALQAIMGNYYKARKRWDDIFKEYKEDAADIDGVKNIETIERLRWDYKRRLGNIVLQRVKWIQEQTYTRNPNRKYKTNDKALKRRLAISARKVRGIMGGLFSAVTDIFIPTAESYHNRLREIEEEMKAEHEKEQQAASAATAPARSSRWNEGK